MLKERFPSYYVTYVVPVTPCVLFSSRRPLPLVGNRSHTFAWLLPRWSGSFETHLHSMLQMVRYLQCGLLYMAWP